MSDKHIANRNDQPSTCCFCGSKNTYEVGSSLHAFTMKCSDCSKEAIFVMGR